MVIGYETAVFQITSHSFVRHPSNMSCALNVWQQGHDTDTRLEDALGLLLRDGQEHRYHRQMLQQSFLKEPMAGYLQIMQPIAENYINRQFR